MSDWTRPIRRGLVTAFVAAALSGAWSGAAAVPCTGPLPPGSGEDLEVTGTCTVAPSATPYKYGKVNIHSGGKLIFEDGTTTFWASSILVESGSSLLAGVDASGTVKPIGTTPGAVLTIYLYGAPQTPGTDTGKGDGGKGITCKTPTSADFPHCGIPKVIWDSNGTVKCNRGTDNKCDLPGNVVDYFYQYHPLTYDDGDPNGYFGYKVLAVSYGGTLRLFGKKGVKAGTLASSDSGYSWARLAGSLKPTDKQLTVDRPVDWASGDRIVVTTTDYLPGHSEQLQITGKSGCNADQLCTTFDVVAVDESTDQPTTNGVANHHNGQTYDLSGVPARLNLDITVDGKPAAETRAAVALLSRSIRLVSAGNALDSFFPDKTGPAPDRYFGGHSIVRQGFQTYQLQGVEFRWFGQGGRIAHYPVHFHMARVTPSAAGNETIVADTSVNESMTRWYVIHATQGVTLARNVGYQSIGHGYYLEDGTEINNKLYSNIGILARAAVDNVQNPRKVPGILAAKLQNPPWAPDAIPFYSDFDHPTIFWIMNGWNDFEYNMAAGAGTCGVCYWLVTGANSYHSRHMTWESYAAIQQAPTNQPSAVLRAGMSPLKRFVGNYCSSAMHSFNTVSNGATCQGVGSGAVGRSTPAVAPIENTLVPPPCDPTNPTNPDNPFTPFRCNQTATDYVRADNYWPKVDQGGGRFPTRCDTADGCDTVNKCAGTTIHDPNLKECLVTVLDRYTSSFHFAETNFGAIWLRPQWYLMINSVLSDVQNAGLGIVTGGGYSSSDHIPGHWGLARKSVFIGQSQTLGAPATTNWFASSAGPVNPQSQLACDRPLSGDHCLVAAQGVSFPMSNFAVNQRLFNIYDGPSYQDSNAYLDITHQVVDGDRSRWVSGPILGLPKNAAGACYMPNAAIGWKQPNGFFYPPAFFSTNLHFHNVDTRHFVIEPLFLPAAGKNTPPYPPNASAIAARYCNGNPGMFTGFTDVDRQTVLNDLDGSLTGFADTISVNFDSPFFTAPTEAVECASDETAKTSPYEHVTTVVYPYCGLACRNDVVNPNKPPDTIQIWDVDCANEMCYGVPLYRQLLTPAEKIAGTVPLVRMSGQSIGQRSTLTANGATYYIDTTVSDTTQKTALQGDPAKRPPKLNVFESGKTYYVFLLYAKPKSAAPGALAPTRQTYQLYVGSGFNRATDVWAVKANITGKPVTFTDPGQVAWPWPEPQLDSKGVLTVTMDMSFDDFKKNYDITRAGSCLPQSFCTPSGEGDQLQCKCSDQLKVSDPQLFAECQKDNDAICSWAIRDVDCPDGGCYGFAVKLGTIAYDPTPDVRPTPSLFTDDTVNYDAYWKVYFEEAPAALAGDCAVKPTPISAFSGVATNVGQGVGKGSSLLKGTFTPALNPPLQFNLASALNVTLNSILHTKPQDGNKELVEGLNLPLRLVRQTIADPSFTATFALAAAGAPLSPRLNVLQNGDRFSFQLQLDNITIRDAPGCGTPNADIHLLTSFGMYDVAQPIDIEVDGEWDCSNKARYIGRN